MRHMHRAALVLVAAAALAAIGFALAFVGGGRAPDPRADPLAGATDAEKDAFFKAASANAEERSRAFIDEFVRLGRDPSRYERAGVMALVDPGAFTLPEAVEVAEVIVVGTVVAVSIDTSTASVWANVDMAITESVLGETGATFRFRQYGAPARDGVRTYIAQLDADPLLRPGDQALLILEEDGHGSGVYRVMPWIGHYRIVDGRLQALEANPVKAEMDGRPLADAVAELRALSAMAVRP